MSKNAPPSPAVDPDDWSAAVEALASPPKGTAPDPRPLAELLRAGEPPPLEVLLLLAELFDPSAALLDVRLVAKPTRAFTKLIARILRGARIAGAMRRELLLEPNVERTAANVADRLGVSDRWVLKVWTPLKRTWPTLYGRQKNSLNKIRAISVQ